MARSKPGLSAKLEFNGMLDYDDEDFLDPKGEDAGRPATIGRTALQRLLRKNSFQEHIMTPLSSGNGEPKMGSVLSSIVSPVQTLRFGSSTVDKTVDNEGLFHHTESGRKKTMGDNDEDTVGDLYETLTESHQSSGNRVRRNDAVTDNEGNYTRRVFEQTYDHFLGGNSEYSSGDFRFLPSSQLQVQNGSKEKSSEHTPLSPPRCKISEDSGGVPERFRQGREFLSVIRNVTIRESKRPKARSSDQDYQRRCSISPSTLRTALGLQVPGHTPGESLGRIPNPQAGETAAYHNMEEVGPNTTRASLGRSGQRPPRNHTRSVKEPDSDDERYDINLSFEGRLVRHTVSRDTWVRQLRDDAARIYYLVSQDLVLVLFGMNPHSLIIQNQLCDPPQVGPGATIPIFDVRDSGRSDYHPNPSMIPPPMTTQFPPVNFPAGPPKFLGNFKLTKFDGSSRNWKQWYKTFIRFLAINQLDHVIEESLLAILPLSPQDFSANKMVYYLLEDTLVPASLAAKYFRQAAKWNGNEAYAKLHDGYVFSGPQTMSLLLSELVNLRFKADESASGF
jgi:hypothetical protein